MKTETRALFDNINAALMDAVDNGDLNEAYEIYGELGITREAAYLHIQDIEDEGSDEFDDDYEDDVDDLTPFTPSDDDSDWSDIFEPNDLDDER